jgi:transposase
MDAAALPDNIEALKSIIVAMDERHRLQVEHLEQQIRLLKKELFGRRSEKRPRPEEEEDGPRQLRLFNEAEAVVAEEKTEPVVVAEHTRQKPKRKPLPPDLPRVEVVHDISEEEKVCACGAALSRIGEEVSEKLDYVPAKIQVIRHIRPKYACRSCEGAESEEPTVKIAPPAPEIIPKGMATAGLLAYIVVSKYCDALPLYRQEKLFARLGIELSRATMASWMVKTAERCAVLIALLEKALLCGVLINCDETPVQVLNEPGRSNTTDSYMWVFRGGDPAKPVVLFKYHPTRSGDVPRQVLQGYQGYLQTDAFSAYAGLEKEMPGIIPVGCFAHVRRNFVRVIDARGAAAKKKPGSAEVALDYIQRLYAVEKIARQKELTPEEIVELRKDKSKPILDELWEWMEKRVSQTPPKGLLGKALNYAVSNWPKLLRYLENGYITPDNNLAENAIRPFVVGRKNWLFAGHPNGAHAAATLYSLIETAKSCGLEPYRYLCFIFEKLPYAQSEEDYAALLPQDVTAEQLTRFIAAL